MTAADLANVTGGVTLSCDDKTSGAGLVAGAATGGTLQVRNWFQQALGRPPGGGWKRAVIALGVGLGVGYAGSKSQTCKDEAAARSHE